MNVYEFCVLQDDGNPNTPEHIDESLNPWQWMIMYEREKWWSQI